MSTATRQALDIATRDPIFSYHAERREDLHHAPPDMLRLIRDAVDAGEYASTSEALRDAVRTWQRQRLEDTERLAALRARVAASLTNPAPSLSETEADARLAALFDATSVGDAAS